MKEQCSGLWWMAQSSGCPIICNMCVPKRSKGRGIAAPSWLCSGWCEMVDPEFLRPGSPFCSLFGDAGRRQGGEGRGWASIATMWHSPCSWLTWTSSPSCERCWRPVETALLESSQHHQCSASRWRLINHWHVTYPTHTYSWVAHVWQWLHCLLGIVRPLLWHWGNLFAACFPLPSPGCIWSMTKTIPFAVYMPPHHLGLQFHEVP